ncbi:Cytosolic Fe-S cluster assembly factor nar1, partial [Fusarium falciforme]
ANSREMAAVAAATADPYHSDYIEVNACPGAWLNGGGLLNGEQNSLKRKQLILLTLGPKLEEAAARPLSLEYVFAPIKQAVEKDLVSVGSTW